MAYEDPNAPSPVSANYVQESSSPVDQSKSFLGGKHHAWRRLFARTVDICTAGFVLFLLLIFAFRSEEHTSELQSLLRISSAVFCLQKKKPSASSLVFTPLTLVTHRIDVLLDN